MKTHAEGTHAVYVTHTRFLLAICTVYNHALVSSYWSICWKTHLNVRVYTPLVTETHIPYNKDCHAQSSVISFLRPTLLIPTKPVYLTY